MILPVERCPQCNRMSLESDTFADYAVIHCVVCGYTTMPDGMHEETYEDEWDDETA